MSSALAPVAVAPRCAARRAARPRDSAAACVSARHADVSARPLRARSSLSRARVSWTSAPRPPSRRGSAVPARAGPRFRDDAERQRAIDRLSPKLPGTTGTGDAGDGPPPEISRPRDVTRPRRFKDAVRDRVDADVRRKARSDPRPAGDEDPGPDPRELARKRRPERAEAESADRLEYLVAVIRAELGRPQSLLSVDGKTRDLRFASCFHRLRNFGAVEIAFGLVKYYDQHWDEAAPTESVGGAEPSDPSLPFNENAFSFRDGDREASESRTSLDELLNDPSVSEETRERAGWARDVLGDDPKDPDESRSRESIESENVFVESENVGASYDDASADERTRRRLLRAAQLKAVGVSADDPRASADYDPEDPDDETNPSFADVLDAFASLVRSYFSVDFVEGEDGNKEMVVMTSPEFLGFLLVAIIVSGRIGHWLVATSLSTPVDPLLR